MSGPLNGVGAGEFLLLSLDHFGQPERECVWGWGWRCLPRALGGLRLCEREPSRLSQTVGAVEEEGGRRRSRRRLDVIYLSSGDDDKHEHAKARRRGGPWKTTEAACQDRRLARRRQKIRRGISVPCLETWAATDDHEREWSTSEGGLSKSAGYRSSVGGHGEVQKADYKQVATVAAGCQEIADGDIKPTGHCGGWWCANLAKAESCAFQLEREQRDVAAGIVSHVQLADTAMAPLPDAGRRRASRCSGRHQAIRARVDRHC
ncbi:hypothetical protein L1887_59321 [Cichorium endivia]|nr:hypothetical protein L1887_59321 [Cichorium endivia]